jgi:PAS domain S-box-containing protein
LGEQVVGGQLANLPKPVVLGSIDMAKKSVGPVPREEPAATGGDWLAAIGAATAVRDVAEHPNAGIVGAWLAAIIECSDDAIVSKTLDGVITSWNPSAERMFGYTAAEAIGQHISLIIPAERHAEEDDVITRVRRGEKVDHFETERLAKDGRLLNISLTVSPIKDASGRVVGASKVARDITDRVRAEADREALLVVAERARMEAENANNVKDEFLAVLSHELRSPMNAMVGWLRILKSAGTRDPALVSRAVETLERNIWIQAQVINDLLDVSRILSGKLDLDEERLDFVALVTGCVESLKPSAEGKQIALRLDARDQDLEVIGDEARLQQVVSNILGNAIKFTDAGGLVTVVVEGTDGGVLLTVEDTGQGIAPEFLPHLFERFRQADGSSARRHGGLGLGLSIVKHIVALHKGSIVAESDGVGHGARFSVLLPRAESRPRLVFATTPASVLPKDTAFGLDVLLVEDDADTRSALEVALGDHGSRVRSAGSVRQALDAYHARPPDVLISDIGLPGENGYVLIRAIRELEEGRSHRTLAIAMTGFAGRQDLEMALRAGFDEHVAKPVEPDTFLERLRVLAASRGTSR